MNIADFTGEIIYENNDGKNVGAISRDKRYLALVKAVNTNDSDLFIYDTSNNSIEQINDQQAGHSISDFSVDGRQPLLYF